MQLIIQLQIYCLPACLYKIFGNALHEFLCEFLNLQKRSFTDRHKEMICSGLGFHQQVVQQTVQQWHFIMLLSFILNSFYCLMFVFSSMHSTHQKKASFLIWNAFCSFCLFDDDICFSRGWQGLIAYGCHSLVLIVDANTAQTLQVLERHKASVVKVRHTCF